VAKCEERHGIEAVERVLDAAHALKDHGVTITATIDHLITKSIYFLDPDGNTLELYCDVGDDGLERIRREGNRLVATLYSEYDRSRCERRVDQVVVEHGTLPLDDLYFELKPQSRNLGELDHASLVANRPQRIDRNPDGKYQLFRIGDAVAAYRRFLADEPGEWARFDALRLLKDL
jgi:hypothetical protein